MVTYKIINNNMFEVVSGDGKVTLRVSARDPQLAYKIYVEVKEYFLNKPLAKGGYRHDMTFGEALALRRHIINFVEWQDYEAKFFVVAKESE